MNELNLNRQISQNTQPAQIPSNNETKVFYCELCDHVSPKLSQYLTHERSSNHIQSCMKYRQEICKDKKQLEAMEKIIKEKMGLQFKNGNELIHSIITLMCKQRLTSSQVKEARDRKKIEEERKLQNVENNQTK
jgi:hypothetical protein